MEETRRQGNEASTALYSRGTQDKGKEIGICYYYYGGNVTELKNRQRLDGTERREEDR